MYLINKKKEFIQEAVLIEEFDYLPSESIYVDIPSDYNINSFLKENLVDDRQIVECFQTPLISSPYVNGSVGGISLTSMSSDSSFARELIKVMQMIVPPEYRASRPPVSAYEGTKFEYCEGIKFALAERPYNENNIFSGVTGSNYNYMATEIQRRAVYKGEYSIFATLSAPEGTSSDVWTTLLKKFSDTEVTLPQSLDTLPELDINLHKIIDEIDERIWAQIVKNRQLKPIIKEESEILKINECITEDIDTLLLDIHKVDKERAFRVEALRFPLQENLKRIAQSFARARNSNEVIVSDLKNARNLIVDNFSGFIKHPGLTPITIKMEKNKADIRYRIIQASLINSGSANINEIFESIKSTRIVRDLYELQEYLDWLHKKGHIILGPSKKYIWVG